MRYDLNNSTYRIGDKKSEALFFFSYGLILAYMIISNSFFALYIGDLWKIVFAVSIAGLFIYELMHEQVKVIDIRNAIATLMLAGFVTTIGSGPLANSISATILLVFCGRNIPFKKIAVFSFLISLLCIAMIVISAYMGIIKNYVEYGARIREYLGFRYSLYGPMLVANCTNLLIYIRKRNISIIELILLVSINYWFFLKTNSRLSFGLTMLLIIVVIIIKMGGMWLIDNKFASYCMIFSFAISGLFSIAIMALYNPASEGMYRINMILGGRLELGKASLLQYGLNMLGNKKIILVGNALDAYGNRSTGIYNHVDCLYLQVAQIYGILFFLLLICVITYALYRSYLEGDWYYLLIMAFVAGHCIIDDLPLYFYNNSFWIGLGPLIMGHAGKMSIQNNNIQQRKSVTTERRKIERVV